MWVSSKKENQEHLNEFLKKLPWKQGSYPQPQGSGLEQKWISTISNEMLNAEIDRLKLLPDSITCFGKFWSQQWPPYSLYLHGMYGCGKTTFAYAIIRQLLRERSTCSYFWPVCMSGRELDGRLLRAVKHEAGDSWELENLATLDLLFIDDLDKITPSDRFKAQFFEVINKRLTNNNPTIITSNCEPKELGSLIGGSVVSRLSDVLRWKVVRFPEKDLRKNSTDRL